MYVAYVCCFAGMYCEVGCLYGQLKMQLVLLGLTGIRLAIRNSCVYHLLLLCLVYW